MTSEIRSKKRHAFTRMPGLRLLALSGAVTCAMLMTAPATAQNATPKATPATAPGSVVKARSTEPDKVTFASALAKQYRLYIREERERYTWDFDRGHFRRKARRAAGGTAPAPDTAGEWSVSGATRVALREGRVRLMNGLEKGRLRAPAQAAKAQVAYDCWAFRAGSRYAQEARDECRWRFFDAINNLEDAINPIRATAVFNRTLAREYAAYADFEAKDQKDYIDSRFFVRKGGLAATSSDVRATEPETLSRWNLLSTSEVPTFVAWRKRLMDALEVHRTSSQARIAALAQVRFDCWVERTSERNDQAHIQRCRREFERHMAALSNAPGSSAGAFVVYFRFDRATIDRSQLRVIRQAAAYIRSQRSRSIQVVGHTDRAGTSAYNLRLSFRRANQVARRLRRLGVPAGDIRQLNVGEAQPAVQTRDGVRRRENRRVEIIIR